MTVLDILKRSVSYLEEKGVDTARLDAELLLSRALGTDRLGVYLRHDQPMTEEELSRCRTLLADRGRRVPVAYLLEEKEFMGRPFHVNRDVLVPRPDTETLVEAALDLMAGQESPGWILDLGTGSGCVACSLLAGANSWRAVATDLSLSALRVAKENGNRLGVQDRLSLVCCDLLQGLGSLGRFSLLAANLPYIPSQEVASLSPEVSEHEPRLALDGGEDGLRLVDRLLTEVQGRLDPGARLLLEVGAGQAQTVAARLAEHGWADIRLLPDLAGIDRVVLARRST